MGVIRDFIKTLTTNSYVTEAEEFQDAEAEVQEIINQNSDSASRIKRLEKRT